MVRVRKLVLAIAAASALTSGMAHALGLGEVTLKSSLNQPLVAEIELLEVRDLGSAELIPTLATPEEFTKAGVDRQYFLTDLKFTPVLKPSGKSVIRVTSSKPVREPYLNFLVEVLWPNGRLLREYTLLLDPPLYSTPTSVAVAPQMPVAAPRTQAGSTPRAPTAATPASRPATPAVASTAGKLEGNEYKTTSSDTLWEIAERVNTGGSVHQTMLAIQDLNPDAFLGGNINRLKNGQVLRIPDAQQTKVRSQTEALAQVAGQNSAWREGRGVAGTDSRQIDATKRTTAGAAPAEATAADNLKLVSAESGKSTTGSDKGNVAESKALNDKLAVTKESLDSTRRENEELKGRMGDLQSQLDKLQRLIQLKDDQLAKLQADMAAQGSKPTEQTPAETPAAVPVTPEPTATPAVEPGASAEPPAATPPGAPDYNYEEPAANAADNTNNQQPASEPAAAVPPVAPVAEQPAAVEPAPAPATPPAAAQLSLVDELLANPMMLGIIGGGALLLLLVVLMVLSRRNALKEAELQNSLSGHDESSHFDNDMTLHGGDHFDELDSPAAPAIAAADERVTAQTGDALGEADIYIAYGRFNQAAELLHNAINDEPQRGDLRVKLMEVYAELGDRDGFVRQENELREIGGSSAAIESLKAKYPAMVVMGAAGGFAAAAATDDLDAFSLDDLTLDEPASPHLAKADDSFDLSLDDLEADLDRDLQAAATSQPAGNLGAELDFSKPAASSDVQDFDFDLDAPGQSLSDDLSDFSLDLDDGAKTTSYEEDSFLLSLDDEPVAAGGSEFSSAQPAAQAADTDFDLPADFDLSLGEETPKAPSADSFSAQLDDVTAELDQLSDRLDQPVELDPFDSVPATASSELDGDDDFDFLSGTDETATKLDLARAYIDMGDTEGARDILDEVMSEGSEGQQGEARELLARLA